MNRKDRQKCKQIKFIFFILNLYIKFQLKNDQLLQVNVYNFYLYSENNNKNSTEDQRNQKIDKLKNYTTFITGNLVFLYLETFQSFTHKLLISDNMQKLHQKQLQKLKLQQKIKQQKYELLLTQMLNDSEQLTQSILYTHDALQSIHSIISNPGKDNDRVTQKQQSLSEPIKLSYQEQFTPSSISKLVFQKHLIKIKQLFALLPDQKAKIEHFLLIMMKVLFIDPSNELKKGKQEEIMKNLLKQKNQKSKLIKNSSINTDNKPTSPKKIKSPPSLLLKKNGKETPQLGSAKLQQKQLPQIDHYPYYIMSLQYMFKEILLPSTISITFSQLQKFIMGESISSNKIDNSNTQFKIQFQQSKVQDFLLHFCGVKKLVYCKNLNIYLCLDVKQKIIKIYSNQLKYNRNYQPNTLRHNRRSPQIIDMWFVDFGNVLGLALADHTIEIINFQAFLTQSYDKKFLIFPRNYIVLKLDMQLKNIYYLQMYNKWFVVGEGDQMLEVNLSKYRSKDQQIIITPFKSQKPQLHITQVIEIISLSLICIVAGNEIWFYDEKLSRKKYHSYVHQGNIAIVKFIQQKNCFYLCGVKEKFLTLLKPQNKRQTMETATITFSKPIIEFQIFTSFNSILLIDDKYTVRLISEQIKQVYQTQQYTRIVKQDQTKIIDQQDRKKISLIKLSNDHFMIFQSYIVSLKLAKVPVETQTDFQFIPYFYFDPLKQQLAISFNNQILVISLIQAQLRQSFTLDNSNLQPLSYFYYSNSLLYKPFVISQQNSIFQLCIKQSQSPSDNDTKKFKKKLQAKNILFTVFDQQLGRCILVCSQGFSQLRNEKSNTFSTLNVSVFSNFQVLSVSYVKQRRVLLMNCLANFIQPVIKQKQPQSRSLLLSINNPSSLSLLSSEKQQLSFQQQPQPQSLQQQQFIFQLNINKFTEFRVIKYQFQKIKQDDKPPVILKCLEIQQYGVKLLLTDQNVIYIVGPMQQKQNDKQQQQYYQPQNRKSFCIKVYHYISPKVRDLLKFNQIYLNSLQYKDPTLITTNKQKKPLTYNSLFLTSQQGFFIEIKLNYLLNKHFTKQNTLKQVQRHHNISTIPQVCQFDYFKFIDQQTQTIKLSKNNVYTFHNQEQEFTLIKAHNACKIQLITKIIIQHLYTVTVGQDGFLKLWNQQKQCIINLKLPTLRKQIFDVKIIKQIRFQRMLEDALQTIKRISTKKSTKSSLNQILTKTRNNQQLQKKYQKIDQKQPIKIDIENKDLQEIINDQPVYSNFRTLDLFNSNSLGRKFQRRYGDKNNDDLKNTHKASKNITLQLRKKRSFQNILEKSSPKIRNSIAMPTQLMELRKHLQKYSPHKQQASSKTIQHKNNVSLQISRNNKSSKQQNKQLLILPKLKDYKMQTITRGFRTERQSMMNNNNEVLDSDDSEYDHFQACTFVKNKRLKKKANELDKIDKQFIRKQFSMIVKKNLAKRKDVVQILSNRVIEQKGQVDDTNENRLNLETIVNDIKRIKYESKYGGDRHIPKVKFKSFSQLQ